MKRLAIQTELKVLGKSAQMPHGGITGYGSYFGNVDHGGDIVMPGAFRKTLADNLGKARIKLVDGHDTFGTDGIIGVVTEAVEDYKGLLITAKFSSTARAQNVRTKVKEGVLDALSIGYSSVRDEENSEGNRELHELKLYEVSIVSWPMNPETRITDSKSDTDASAILREIKAAMIFSSIKSMTRSLRAK